MRGTKTTICGTDLHFSKGDVPMCTQGRVLNHEAVDVIASAPWLIAPLPFIPCVAA